MPYESEYFEKVYKNAINLTMTKFQNFSKRLLSFNQMTKRKEQFQKRISEDYEQRKVKNIKISKVVCERIILEFDNSF